MEFSERERLHAESCAVAIHRILKGKTIHEIHLTLEIVKSWTERNAVFDPEGSFQESNNTKEERDKNGSGG